jgi:hypothetical protein
MARPWTHLIRFIAKEDGRIHLGQIDAKRFPDVGMATFQGKMVDAQVISGSVYDGVVTDRVLHVAHVSVDVFIRLYQKQRRDHQARSQSIILQHLIQFLRGVFGIRMPEFHNSGP